MNGGQQGSGITIVLESPRVRGGELLEFDVVVVAPVAGACEIDVEFVLRATSEPPERHRARIFDGELQAGESIVPLVVRPPRGPSSYHGKDVTLAWQLRVEATIASTTLADEVTIDLRADPESVEPPSPLALVHGTSLGDQMTRALGGGSLVAFLILFGGPYLGLSMGAAVVAAGIAFATILIGMITFGVEVEDDVVPALGIISLEVDPQRLCPGESFEVCVASERGAPPDLGDAYVRLFVAERVDAHIAVSKHESSEDAIQNELFEDRRALSHIPNAPIDFRTTFAIPEGAPESFLHKRLQLSWFVELVIHHRSRRYVDRKPVVVVAPGREISDDPVARPADDLDFSLPEPPPSGSQR